jgi:hypothetical protein
MSIEDKLVEECLANNAKYAIKTSFSKYRCCIYRYAKHRCKYYYEEYETFKVLEKEYVHTYKLCRYHEINK